MCALVDRVDPKIYCPPPLQRKEEGHSFWHIVHPSVLPPHNIVGTLYAQLLKQFMPILSKLNRCFCNGLKICMWFGYNPQIIFVTFLQVELDHFRRFYWQPCSSVY